MFLFTISMLALIVWCDHCKSLHANPPHDDEIDRRASRRWDRWPQSKEWINLNKFISHKLNAQHLEKQCIAFISPYGMVISSTRFNSGQCIVTHGLSSPIDLCSGSRRSKLVMSCRQGAFISSVLYFRAWWGSLRTMCQVLSIVGRYPGHRIQTHVATDLQYLAEIGHVLIIRWVFVMGSV